MKQKTVQTVARWNAMGLILALIHVITSGEIIYPSVQSIAKNVIIVMK